MSYIPPFHLERWFEHPAVYLGQASLPVYPAYYTECAMEGRLHNQQEAGRARQAGQVEAHRRVDRDPCIILPSFLEWEEAEFYSRYY